MSGVVKRIIDTYEILCSKCKQPYAVGTLDEHEATCQKLICANELCHRLLDSKESAIRFFVDTREAFACSKKCKKVSRFA